MKYEDVPCGHETDGIPVDVVLDDYYPLTSLQISLLLDESLYSSNPSKQQVRLNQCIKGILCPRETNGDVAEKVASIDILFMKGYRNRGWSSKQKKEIYRLCGN